MLQEEMQNEAEQNKSKPGSAFPGLLPEEEIQKVIFDQQYLKYMKKRMEED